MAEQQRKELSELEKALRALAPQPSRVDAARLMFEAGRQSARYEMRRLRWLWPTATATMSVAATVLAVMLVFRVQPTVVDRIVYVKPEIKSPEIEEAVDEQPVLPREPVYQPSRPRIHITKAGYLRDRQTVLALGVDALPSYTSHGNGRSEPPTAYPALRRRYFQGNNSDTDRNENFLDTILLKKEEDS